MKLSLVAAGALLAGLGLIPATSAPQATPAPTVATYSTLADTILALKQTEANFIRSVLAMHYHGAESYAKVGESGKAAAEMALFANEGDNAMAGVRKRLLEGGHHHHHHSDDTSDEEFDPGFVVVTRKAKEAIMGASAAMRGAGDDAARTAAWEGFRAVAEPLLAGQ